MAPKGLVVPQPKIRMHTHRAVASPATGPLLGFLIHFARQKEDYLDVLHQKNPKKLWKIGHKYGQQYVHKGTNPCFSDSGSDWTFGWPSSCESSSGSESGGDGKSTSSGGSKAGSDTDTDVPDESEQDKATLMGVVNGTTFQPLSTTNPPTVTIVGAGVSGLVAGYELKKLGFKVRLLEASSRVGGRVITFRDPVLAPGLHAEGGAMRIPANHYLLRAYIANFNIDTYLPFEMKNKFIYLSNYRGGTTLTYDDFNNKLTTQEAELLKLFPGLKASEKGKTCDQLFFEAVAPVVATFKAAYKAAGTNLSTKIRAGYQAVTDAYDKYTLRSYLEEVASWSFDAIRLFDLGNAHVVFENAFIESWKDAFLSSNTSGEAAGMDQLQGGMDQVPKAFISPDRGTNSLAEDITYGARVTHVVDVPAAGDQPSQIQVTYENPCGTTQSVSSNYVIFAVPYGAQRAITKSRPFSQTIEQAIRDVRYIEITKVLLQYRTRWWETAAFGAHNQGTDGGLISDLPIRYTMFPTTAGNSQCTNTARGAVMASYTFQQDATILGAMSAERRVRVAAQNIDTIFPSAGSLQLLEAGTSQVFPSDELAGGSAFCYFGPGQKSTYLETMCTPDWADPADTHKYRVFFAGEHASYTHGWIHGAMEAGLRCVEQVYASATTA